MSIIAELRVQMVCLKSRRIRKTLHVPIILKTADPIYDLISDTSQVFSIFNFHDKRIHNFTENKTLVRLRKLHQKITHNYAVDHRFMSDITNFVFFIKEKKPNKLCFFFVSEYLFMV